MSSSTNIYFDYNATAPMLEEIRDYIMQIPLMPYNPSSVHYFGRRAKLMIEEARENIARSLNVSLDDYDVIFTSCGSESNNQIINSFKDYDLYITKTEHPSIMLPVKSCEKVTYIDIDSNGVIDPVYFEELLSQNENKKLISISLANNQTGVIQDVKTLASIAHKYNGIVYSDAIQAYSRIEIDLKDLEADILTIASIKVGAGHGTSAIIIKKGIVLNSLLKGGGQERGYRAGTENVISIAAFGKLAEMVPEIIKKYEKVRILRNLLENKLVSCAGGDLILVSHAAKRLPNTSNIIMKNISNQLQIVKFDLAGIALSAGSACSSGKVTPSYVLLAQGYNEEEAKQSIRVSLAPANTKEEIDIFVEKWNEIKSGK